MQISETVIYLMVAAIGLGAVALAAQAVGVILMVRAAREVRARLDRLTARADETLEAAGETLKSSRQQINEITTKVNDLTATAGDILETTRDQVKRTDEFLTEATQRARVQLDRVELVLDDSISRIHETILLLNRGVLIPVRQVTGVVSGVRTALDYFLRGGRPDVSQATTDEEMFI